MKRTLLAATAVALLLTGCATGDTGHVNPEISPDLREVRSTPREDQPSGDDDEGETVETPAPGASAQPTNDVEAAFAASSEQEAWYADVTAVDVDSDTVVVSTRLEPGDTDAVAVCEAALGAAEEVGILTPSADIRAVDGETIAKLDVEAGDQGCANVG